MELIYGQSGNQGGQAITEYILLLLVVVSAYLAIVSGLAKTNLVSGLTQKLTQSFRYTYQYGDPSVRGYDDDGGPVMHPRIIDKGNFRIFINNPDKKR